MKRILFIIQSYPSEWSANVICDEKIMESLKDTGEYDIHCLTFQYDKQPLYEEINGFKIHRFKRSKFWDLYTWARHNTKKTRAKCVMKLNRLFLRIKQFLTVPIFPYYEPFVARKYAKEAFKLYQKYNFDIVVAEHNGLDTLYAGRYLKRKKQSIIYVQIFWDALSGGFAPKYLPKKFVDYKKRLLEKSVLEESNISISMQSHKEHMDKFWEKSDVLKKVVYLDIPYLDIKKESLLEAKHNGNESIKIVFAGNMGMRNPDYFFKVIACSKLNILVQFYTAEVYHKKVIQIAENNDVQVQVNNYVPHSELEKVLGSADILLNFGVDNPNAISGKIFEYIGFKKPIISTYSIDNEASILPLSKYPIAFLMDERIQNYNLQAKRLDAFIQSAKDIDVDNQYLEKVYRNNMPETYVGVIKDLLEEDE